MKKEEIIMKNYIYLLIHPETKDVVYVGKTKNPSKRLKDHCRRCRGKYRSLLDKWKNNLIDSGNFPIMEIIKECDVSNVNIWEKHYISEYRNRGIILNMTDGGDGLQNPSDEVRKKIGIKSKGRYPSKETRDKISKAHYNSGNKILCYNYNKEFIGSFINSRRASETLNIGYKNISKILNGKEYFIKGYTFFIDGEFDIEKKLEYRIENTINLSKSFLRISKNGDKKIYSNILEASRENNCNFRNIWLCLTNKRKTCAGFIWVYEDSLNYDYMVLFEKKTSAKMVRLIKLNGEVFTFKSLDDASSKTDTHKSNICSYLKKKVKPRSGDIWEYI